MFLFWPGFIAGWALQRRNSMASLQDVKKGLWRIADRENDARAEALLSALLRAEMANYEQAPVEQRGAAWGMDEDGDAGSATVRTGCA